MNWITDWIEDNFGKVCLTFAAVVIGSVLYVSIIDSKESQRLITQCMDDGRKEYECRAMFRVTKQAAVMPMPVIIGR